MPQFSIPHKSTFLHSAIANPTSAIIHPIRNRKSEFRNSQSPINPTFFIPKSPIRNRAEGELGAANPKSLK
jgi:hypothetical protein